MDEIKSKNIVKIIGHYVELKPRGSSFLGLCPFHKEKTPSFYVHPKKKIFKCFGCGKGGDVATFLMEFKGIDFKAVLKELEIEPSNSLRNKPISLIEEILPPSIIPDKYLKQSLEPAYQNRNYFIQWLNSIFPKEMVREVVDEYYVGSSKHWRGATAFWQIDTNCQSRQVKVFLYDPKTGKRRKWKNENDVPSLETTSDFFTRKNKMDVYAMGKRLLKKEDVDKPNIQQCFFGEHLIHESDRIVAIVESEKSAIVMSLFSKLKLIENYTWIATGGKNGCQWYRPKVWHVLKGKQVVLFPDLGAHDDWLERSQKLKHKNKNLIVSDVLKKNALPNDVEVGFDIADYFILNYLNSDKSSSSPILEFPSIELPKIPSREEKRLQQFLSENILVESLIERFSLVVENVKLES